MDFLKFVGRECLQNGMQEPLFSATTEAPRKIRTYDETETNNLGSWGCSPAHSALHAVQYGKKMTHFTQWVIEGQALLHELAYQQLIDGETVRFSKYLPMAVYEAPRKLDPSSEESIRAHIADCVLYGSECLDFHSFSGSIYLEKLILDFGVEKYRDFFRQIWSADDLGISPVEVWEFYAGEVFVDVYGIDLESWLDEVGIPYLASVYAGAGY